MTKKNTPSTAVTVVESAAKTDNVVRFEMSDVAEFAVRLGVELSAPVEERADSAAEHMSRSQRHMLAAGVLLMSIKAECEHGRFTELLEERGFEERAARRSMQYAQFILARPEEEREALIGLPKSKVLALAGADPEVIEAMLEGGTENIDALSVRALQQQLSDIKASLADTAVQRDTAEAELAAAKKRLAKLPTEREDAVPLVVADLRAEIVAQQKKAELAVDAFHGINTDLGTLHETEEAHDWADATLRLGVSALMAVRLQIDGVLKQFLQFLPGQDPTPAERSYLTQQEVVEAAKRYAELTALHEHEKALREWGRAQDRPRGKGRPQAKPEAPKAR